MKNTYEKPKHALGRVVVGACTAALLVGAVATQTASADKRGFKGDMLRKLDTDGSGGVSLAEMLVKMDTKTEKKFGRQDKNADGVITLDEHSARGHKRKNKKKRGNDETRASMRECMQAALGDREDRPTREESFAKADSNGDGSLDSSEFSAHRVAYVTERFNRLDADVSGEITAEEFKAMAESRKQRKSEHKAARKTCREQVKSA